MKNQHTFVVGMLLVVIILVAMTEQQTYALAILKFKVPKVVAPNQSVKIVGTSMAPNSTNTNCNVQFQTNGAGYQPVTGLGPSGQKYVNWTTTSAPLQAGVNSFEAQLLCFGPSGAGAPNLIKHLVHNVTTGVVSPTSTSAGLHQNSNNIATSKQQLPTSPNTPAVQ